MGKIYFKYNSGSRCFFQCHEVDGEIKFIKPLKRLDECFTNEIVFGFDEDEYNSIVNDYKQQINEWDVTKEVRDNASEDGYITYRNDYLNDVTMKAEKYITKRFIKYRKFNKVPFKVFNCEMKKED
ncbi:hypothetical protein ACFLKB_17910 (plasmid) [Clostridium sp. FAM 1755]|uniref:hypothetical protein n=1 Tax=Clostridium caseinilyticum TaxID=3350403 RepID=UPI0038F7F99C